MAQQGKRPPVSLETLPETALARIRGVLRGAVLLVIIETVFATALYLLIRRLGYRSPAGYMMRSSVAVSGKLAALQGRLTRPQGGSKGKK